MAVWKQSPICHLPVIYLFGLVTGPSYCSLKSKTVGKHVLLKHKVMGSSEERQERASEVGRDCKGVQGRSFPSGLNTQNLGWGLGAGGWGSNLVTKCHSADLQFVITKLGRRRRWGRKREGGARRRERKKEEVGRPDHTMVPPGCSGPVLEAGPGCVHLEILYTKSFRTPGS